MALYPIASDLSYFVLKQRRRLGELSAPELNQANRCRYPALVTRRPYVRVLSCAALAADESDTTVAGARQARGGRGE